MDRFITQRSRHPLWNAAAAVVVAGLAGLAQANPPTLEGFVIENGYFSPTCVSQDGAVVAGGTYVVGQGDKARRWRRGLGFDYEAPDSVNAASWTSGMSYDGQVIAGGTGHAAFGDLEGWVRYGGGVGHIGAPPGHDTSSCNAVSGDGVVAVGYGGHQANPNLFEAAYYTEQDEWTNLGFLPGGNNTMATAVNADGSVIAGWSDGGSPPWYGLAFRWDAAHGMVSIGSLGSGTEPRPTGCDATGQHIVGYDYDGNQTAWMWTPDTGMFSLGVRPTGTTSAATAVSPDGQVVVGWADDGGANVAFLWDAAHGMRSLKAVLIDQGLPIDDWELGPANAIAGNGPWWICGDGYNLATGEQGWLARLESLETATTAVQDSPASTAVAVLAAGPTPSRGPIDIRFRAPQSAASRLQVFDLRGRLVTTITTGVAANPEGSARWLPDASVPAGVYRIRLESAGRISQRSVVLLH
jgi:probable HAF family extracellular repeat protein